MITALATVIVLGVLVFVHELGHFLMAKLFGVRVDAFSLGFPPKLLHKQIGETDYRLSVIPLGGYVKLFGENPKDEVPPELEPVSFSHHPLWHRFLIVLAGPVFNLIFAVFGPLPGLYFFRHSLSHHRNRRGERGFPGGAGGPLERRPDPVGGWPGGEPLGRPLGENPPDRGTSLDPVGTAGRPGLPGPGDPPTHGDLRHLRGKSLSRDHRHHFRGSSGRGASRSHPGPGLRRGLHRPPYLADRGEPV